MLRNGFGVLFVVSFSLSSVLALAATRPDSAAATRPESAAASRFMLPQPKKARGPWFEGWYIRVTDADNHRSFATITTSSTEKKLPLRQDSVLPGYIAFIYDAGDGQPTKSREFFPAETSSRKSGTDFQWRAPGFGTLTPNNLNLALPSGEEISVALGQRYPWKKSDPDWGPEGLAGFVPDLPLYWYVDSLGTPATYRVKLAGGEVWEGRGYAHVEKNWGGVFPKAWMWAQAVSRDNREHLALAGGPLGFGPVELTSYLVGYKSDKFDVEIRPDELSRPHYRTRIDACAGIFELAAYNAPYEIRVRAVSPRSHFAPVSMPTKQGFLTDHGMESFAAQIDVELYRDGQRVESQHFDGAALEFGADNMLCHGDRTIR